ncbi:hypothetical protein RND81_14G058900 [Saponaria officinalis]|uniref:J domain-containing protein n=1 Tax=Saponaria officinalis TaxID=3572 RepID=A0AAW1GLP8_SAPOF
MIIVHVGVGPTSTTVYGGRRWLKRQRSAGVVWVTAAVNNGHKKQNHYAVLGVPTSASSADIKKAFRLLARKWHPDVSKDTQAAEMFKNIHMAYQVLSDKATRIQYDRVLKSHDTDSIKRNIYRNFGTEDELEVYGWSEWQKMQREKRRKQYYRARENLYYTESDEQRKNNTPEEERGSFIEVLQSVFLSVFLMQTVGCQLSLIYTSLTAWIDGKLDAGYKLGYLIAWVLGGKGGVLLSVCLSFASWACGKNSSSIVTLVVVAMWVGSNLLSYAPLPQGALLALLYMSAKLQGDLKF